MLPPKTEERLRHFLDRDMQAQDALYNVQAKLFRAWLNAMQTAMEDENIEPSTIEAVLNRVLYGHPPAADAQARLDEHQRRVEIAMNHPWPVDASGLDPFRKPRWTLNREKSA